MGSKVLFSLLASLATAFAADAGKNSLVFQGSVRSRLEAWDWFQGEANDSYQFLGNIIRFELGQQLEKTEWKLEFAAPVLLGLPDDAVAPGVQGQLGMGAIYFVSNSARRNAAMLFPKQAYVRFKHIGGRGHSLRLGRFEFSDGAEVQPKSPTLVALKNTRIQQRLLGPFGFVHVGRSFDGFHYTHETGPNNVTVVGAFPTRGVFQVDGWGWVNVGIGYGAWTRQLSFGKTSAELRAFGLYYHDWRSIAKVDNRAAALRAQDLANVRVGSFGGHYLQATTTSSGIFDLLAWGVGQFGKWSSLDHKASAIALEAGYQPPGLKALKPWLRGGYFHGSGDSDPNDASHGTFFNVLPTPRIYARFPFFNLMNVEDRFGELILRPHTKISIRADVHALRLAQNQDLWYLGGGAYNPWTFGYTGRAVQGARGLATFYDAGVDINATGRLSLGVYFGYAGGKSVMANIYPKGQNAQLGYIEATWRF
jgi:hypothetical protein